MNKEEFLILLRHKLNRLPQDEIEDRVSFYNEMIEDEISDGKNEEEVIQNLGPIDEIVSQIIGDVPLSKIIKEKVTPKRKLKAWEILLIVLGFPLWFPLLLTGLILFLVAYILIMVMIIVVYALDISFICGGFVGIFGMVQYAIDRNGTGSFFMVGATLVSFGLGILLILFSKGITLGIINMTKNILKGTKRMIVGKEKQ